MSVPALCQPALALPAKHVQVRPTPLARLNAGDTLQPGGQVQSQPGGPILTMQASGALVEHDAKGNLDWSSLTLRPHSHARLGRSGALQVLSRSGRVLWSSHSGGHVRHRFRLVVRNDGTLVIRTAAGTTTWTNHLGSRCRASLPSQAIIVSISLQHLWACHHARLVLTTPVTTGAYQRGWITPTGTWRVYGKRRNVNLIGPSWDDHVRYWMPYDGPFGLHDARWQTFPEGSSKYKTKGSHGCVHVPMSEMKALYAWVRIGTPVTVRR